MIVCLCRGLADHAILAMIERGGDTRERLAATCGAGADCGSCASILDALLDEARDASYSGRALRPHLAIGGPSCAATSRSSPS
ncbi:MAG: (2Fe-2S)-binding protein [Candidatus Rokuibacteriota bacterium]|nr:MAG: (2Fe-2S)-binding protein [Candidatus Rokubacteria bacterium]